MVKFLFPAACCLLLICNSYGAVGDSWNLNDEWDTVNNPSGPWTYHEAPGTVLTVFGSYGGADFPLGENGWKLSAGAPAHLGIAEMVHDQTGGGAVPSYYAGDVVGHTNSPFGAQWVAPTTLSNATISGGIYKLRNGMGSVFVTLIVDGVTMLDQVKMEDGGIGTDRNSPYTFYFNGLAITAGAVVDLQLNSGGENGDYGAIADFSIVENPTPPVTSWNLADDWSTTSNPTDTWTYHESPGVPMTVFGPYGGTDFPLGENGWQLMAGMPAHLGIARMVNDQTGGGAVPSYYAGDVVGHTSSPFGAQWVAPKDVSDVTISGSIYKLRNTMGYVYVTLIIDGVTMLDQVKMEDLGLGANRDTPYTFSFGGLTLNAGAVVDLQLNSGGLNGDYGGIADFSIRSDPASECYYVATDGDNTNAGTIDSPFKTIAHAKDVVRGIIAAGLTKDVVVYLRGGTYYLDDTLQFGPEDSGSYSYKITYKSYPGENAIISGGEEITGWASIGGDKYTMTLPDVAAGTWWFRQLWAEGQRYRRAYWEVNGLMITGVSGDYKTITLNSSIPGDNLPDYNTELVVYNNWALGRGRVTSKSGSTVTTATVCGSVGTTELEPTYGKPVFMENHPDYIDLAKEWYLNPNTGVLTYQAEPGVNPNTQTFVAPRLERLLMIRGGSTGAKVRNLVFEGLSFRHTGWDYPSFGYGAVQAGQYNDGGATGVPYRIHPAVELAYTENCIIEKCSVANIATTGIGLGIGCTDNQIINCELSDIGGTGIMCGWDGEGPNYAAWTFSDSVAPYGNIISNNYIHNAAVEWRDCVGIYDGQCKYTEITNNIVSNLPYTGISVGWRWTPEVYTQEGTLVQQNHIYDILWPLCDGGGIYTLGNHQGGLLSGNLIHDVHIGWYTISFLNVGIFFDQGSSYLHCENTITYNIDGGTQWRDNGIGTNRTFGTNYWNRPPASWDSTMQVVADAAGVHPVAPILTISADCDNVLVVGSCEPWAQIDSAVIQETSQDISGYLTVTENGSIYGIIPKTSISSSTTTVQVVVSDPEGDLSNPGTSSTIELYIKGDIDTNCVVDVADLADLASQWLTSGCEAPEWCSGADLDGSGKVDLQDFSLLGQNWLLSQ